MTPLRPDWTGRTVLVTGHSGFVGSWLAVVLTRLGARVVGYASSHDVATRERDAWLRRRGVIPVPGDVRDRTGLLRATATHQPDLIIHLAAQPLVFEGYRAPAETMETNIVGSINVLEAARVHGPAGLIHVTSDKTYRNMGWERPYRENDPIGGGCPYSASKAAAEIVFESYVDLLAQQQPQTRAASVRFGNVLGGGDRADRIVPNALRALRGGPPVPLRLGGRAVRPWQHVLDVAIGVLRLGDGLLTGTVRPGEVLNFAPPSAGDTVTALLSALGRHWGTPVPTVGLESGPHEELLVRLDGRRATESLDWQHVLDLDGVARWIVRWERSLDAGDTAPEATAAQVDTFLADLISPVSPGVAVL